MTVKKPTRRVGKHTNTQLTADLTAARALLVEFDALLDFSTPLNKLFRRAKVFLVKTEGE